jgi:hypothetical protein
MGRPSIRTEAIEERIIDGLLEGLSLARVCDAEGMPNRRNVLRWMEADEVFAAKCARARLMQAEIMDDMILDEARACTPEMAQVAKVRISAYQWRASKLAPKKYGDRVTNEHTGPDGGPMMIVSGVPRRGE